jgi:saccharopine dehydrogenase-like NADP-dependent oxidoreductase
LRSQNQASEMKKILIIGAGRSCSSLVKYLGEHSTQEGWTVTVTDRDSNLAKDRVEGLPNCEASSFDALNSDEREKAIQEHDLIVSMLPARFHIDVVRDCIRLKKDIITPSYVTDEINALDQEAKDAGIIILNEMGLDPGIDHMSAMKIIDDIKWKGGIMRSFKSFTGGLVAPESDNNPWNYKFTWNPRNVVLAGQGGAAEYIRKGRYKYIAYNNLFNRTEIIPIEGYSDFEGYANRDSLKYRSVYGLEGIDTIYRGTLRKKGYSIAWNCFVQLGMTDDTYEMQEVTTLTNRGFLNSFLTYDLDKSVEDKMCERMNIEKGGEIFRKLEWLGLFENNLIGLKKATPAQALQKILEGKLSLDDGDKDMIVMWHQFIYEVNGKSHQLESHMVAIGEDETYTGMAKTVGFPIGIAAKLILRGEMNMKGVFLPTRKDIYEPVLKELEDLGIVFVEKEV